MNRTPADPQTLAPYYEAIWQDFLESGNLEAEIEQHRVNRRRFHRLIGACLHRVPSPSPQILEIGSGTAIDSYIVAEDYRVSVTGVDLSVTSIEVARRIGRYFSRPLTLMQGDAERLPFPDATFDVVYSQGVLEHFQNPWPMLHEQLRVLKPEGFLVINVPQRHTGYTAYKHEQMQAGTWPWGWETEYSYRDLRRLGRRLDLAPVAVTGYDYWPTRRGWAFWRQLHVKVQSRNPWRANVLCRRAEQLYERTWVEVERRWGHYFLINITVAFQRAEYARRLRWKG